MKKRAISLFLAVLMLFSALPVTALAVAKITLKSGAAVPSTLYAGQVYTLKVPGKTVNFYSSNKKIATIDITTGMMKVLAPGTVKITAKDSKTLKAVASKTFTVLQRAQSVKPDSDVVSLSAAGDTATIRAALVPETSTDVIRFYSSDKTVATVGLTSGKVTAVNEGICTVTVYAKATKATSTSNKGNKIAVVTVCVGTDIPPESREVEDPPVTEEPFTEEWDMTVEEYGCADLDFTPDETGWYVFTSEAGNDVNLTAELYDEEDEFFTGTDGNEDGNFWLYAYLYADSAYRLSVMEQEGRFTSFRVKVYRDYDAESTGSVFSEGNVWLLLTVAVLVGGGVAVLAILKKKKMPETADGEDDE